MNSRSIVRALAVVVFPVALVFVGCGQDVATCASICTTSPGCVATVSSDCTSACTTYQTSCTTNNGAGDFQELLTCISDSNDACNGFASVPPLCDTEMKAVESICGGLPN